MRTIETMESLENLIRTLPKSKPQPALVTQILKRVEKSAAQRQRRHLVFFSSLFAVSSFSTLVALWLAFQEIVASGFFSYASLLMSDTGVVCLNSREILLTLIESAPLSGITLTLALLFIALFSARAFAKSLPLHKIGMRAA